MGAKTKGMATAVGTAILLYMVLSGRLSVAEEEEAEWRLLKEAAAAEEEKKKKKKLKKKEEEEEEKKEMKKGEKRLGRWPDRPPATLGEAVAVAANTVRFTYSETLGKWPLGEIAFGIKYYMKQQGNLLHEYAGSNSVHLKGHEIQMELAQLLKYLKLCMFFSKKPFRVFLEFGGYCRENVLIKKSKARLLKPAFTIVRDETSKCFLLFIRGAISVKDRLTAATSAEVPFHHIVLHEGSVRNLILGYAHCGMVAAARWIAACAIPCLHKAVQQFPDYKIKIIGHSMGAGVAALLTYILHEHESFQLCTCIAFAPAACMTWELAESGKDFITTLINRTDLVPTFSKVSASNLRTEVMASSWLNDLRDQIQHTRILNLINRSVSFTRSHIPFISNPRSKVVDADMLADPLSGAKDATTHTASTMHSRPSCWSCIATCKIPFGSAANAAPDYVTAPVTTPLSSTCAVENTKINTKSVVAELVSGRLAGSDNEDLEEETDEDKKGLFMKEIKELQAELLLEAAAVQQCRPFDTQEARQLYPPGRIMHMLILPSQEAGHHEVATEEETVSIHETPRELYGKIRLARSMIRDHYMPRYIKTLELLIDKLGKDSGDSESL